jgi:hypothetical protein
MDKSIFQHKKQKQKQKQKHPSAECAALRLPEENQSHN